MMAAATKTPVVTAENIRAALCIDSSARATHCMLDAVPLYGDAGRIAEQHIK
jgi:hypothetical protein